MSGRRFALVAGGGTAGHTTPALAIARALAATHGPDAVELVGSRHGLDAQLLSGVELPVTLLPGRGLLRRIGPAATARNLRSLAELAWSLVLALALVHRRRPAVVVAVGGYAAVAPALAAAALRIPIVVVNIDAVPGAANRLVGRLARAAAVAFPGTDLPGAVVTGAPVRPEILAARRDPVSRRRAKETLGMPADRPLVAAVGGSLGARRINEAVVGLALRWSERSDRSLYHVVGRRDAAWAAAQAVPTGPLRYHQAAYEARMAAFLEAADVVVCRAGANTVAELTVVGVPAVLVPLPGAPGDHQTANARVLASAAAAVLVPDAECTAARLDDEVGALLAAPARLEAMAAAAAALGRPEAAGAVAELAEGVALAGRGRGRRGRGGSRRGRGRNRAGASPHAEAAA